MECEGSQVPLPGPGSDVTEGHATGPRADLEGARPLSFSKRGQKPSLQEKCPNFQPVAQIQKKIHFFLTLHGPS